MANTPFEAGSILVAIKAQIDALQSGIADAKADLASFGQAVSAVSSQVQQSSRQITAGLVDPISGVTASMSEADAETQQFMDDLRGLGIPIGQANQQIDAGASSVRQYTAAVDRSGASALGFAKGVGKIGIGILKVNALVSTFVGSSAEGMGELSKAISAVIKILGVLSVAVSLGFGPVGIAIAAVAGLGAAIFGMLQPTEEETEALAAMTKEIDDLAKGAEEARKTLATMRTEARVRVGFAEGGDAKFAAGLQELERRAGALKDRIVELAVNNEELQKAMAKPNLPTLEYLRAADAIKANKDAAAEFRKELDAVNASLARARVAQAESSGLKAFSDLVDETAKNLEVLKVRMQLGLITPLEEAEARSAEAARALESGFRAMQQAADVVGRRRAEEVFGPQLASLMAQVAATKRVSDAQKAAAEEKKKADEEAKRAAEDAAKLEEDRATRSAENLQSLLDGIDEEIQRVDDVRSLDEVEIKIKEKNRALQDLINAGRLTEFEIVQARNGIEFLQSKLREEGFQKILDEVAERKKSIEAGGQELSQREQVIRLQDEVLAKFRGTADQAERIRAAFGGLYGAALQRDQDVALKRFDEFTKNLDGQLRSVRDIGEAEKFRLQIDDLIAEKNKLIKDGLVDQKRENEANAKIEALRVGLIQKATRETGAEIDAFVQMQRAQREQTDNVGKAAELRKKALERFGVGTAGELPAEIQVKLDEASLEEARGKFDQAFSKPFAATFSEAVRSSILGGQDAMQTLAQFGQGLFDDWIGEVTRQLQEGVSNALTQALGAGGQALGGALQGALGLAGLFLSKGAGNTSSRFGAVQSGVTASQAVRGIVAGPESVAVASVGDNMQRAIVPVVLRLDSIIGILTDIRGGRAAAPSFAFAGTVPNS